jgi:uncharacterized protein (DUF433 family)
MASSCFTPAQASVVANLPLKSVHKLMDIRLVRPVRRRVGGRVQRFLSAEQLLYLRVEGEGVRLLPIDARREVALAIEKSPRADVVRLKEGQAVAIHLKEARKRVAKDLGRLKKAEAMAVSDAEILRGTPVYRGTRIPVGLVANMLAQGATPKEIVEGYPSLKAEMVELAPLYVKAFPRRGRPAQRPWAKQKPIGAARSVAGKMR